MKDSFILYTSFYEPLKLLSEKQLGRLFKAIFEYQISEKTDVDADIQMAFAFIKTQMDINERKYRQTSRTNSENGKKGGRPPKKDNQLNIESDDKSEKSERFSGKAKKA